MQDLVNGYNSTVHSSIKMTPIKVGRKDQVKIRQLLYAKQRVKKYKYKVNDSVRISKARRTFKKGYLPNWTEEIFTITSRESKIRPVYSLKDYNNQKFAGKFYEEELQLVELPEEFHIEKVLRKKTRGNQTRYFVKWKGYNNSFNSLVSEKD